MFNLSISTYIAISLCCMIFFGLVLGIQYIAVAIWEHKHNCLTFDNMSSDNFNDFVIKHYPISTRVSLVIGGIGCVGFFISMFALYSL